MKKHLIGNLILSGIVFTLLFILSIILEYNFSAYYYLTTAAFFCIYLAKSLVLFKLRLSPSKYTLVYSFITILKMLVSVFFLAGYYLVFAKSLEPETKNHFLIFFVVLYFGYLIINTKMLFNQPSE